MTSPTARSDFSEPTLSPNATAAFFMIGSSAALAGTLACIRQLPDMNPMQIAFFRYLFGVMLFLPWLVRQGALFPKTNRLGRHMFRALTGLAGMVSLFFAVRLMPLTEVTSLSFTAPLFAVIGGAIILKEYVSRHRAICTLIGFCGALIILRPGMGTFVLAGLVPIIAALFIATATLATKTLSRTDTTTTIVFYFTVLVTPLSFLMALPFWTMPELTDWFWLLLIAVLATASQMLLTQALHKGEASFVLPFDYSQLVFSALLGLMVYAETPSIYTAAGSCVIVGAALLSLTEGRRFLSVRLQDKRAGSLNSAEKFSRAGRNAHSRFPDTSAWKRGNRLP